VGDIGKLRFGHNRGGRMGVIGGPFRVQAGDINLPLVYSIKCDVNTI